MILQSLEIAARRGQRRNGWTSWLTALAACGALAFGAPSRAADHPPAAFGDVEEPVEDVDAIIVDLGDLEINGDVEAMEVLAVDGEVEFAADLNVVIEGDVVINGVVEAADNQKPDADDWDDELEPDPAAAAQPRFVVNDETFDQWVFNQVGNAQKATERFHTTLNVQIDSIATACELAPEQKQKLLLAGQGDIHRFFDKVEVCRKKFDVVKTDQNRINEIFLDIQPLQIAATAGLFDEKSLFRKVVKRTLNDEQRAKVDQVEKERRQYQFKAKVELIVAALDDTIAMRADQRKELTAMLLATPAPKRYGPYDSYLLLFKISRLPEDKMKKLLDPPQWRALDKQLEQARNLQPFLRQQGLLSDDELVP